MNIAYNMDCMEAMRKMPDKCFDLAVVDPPYGDGSQVVHVERERESRTDRGTTGSAGGSTVTRVPRGGGTARMLTTSAMLQNRRRMGREARP